MRETEDRRVERGRRGEERRGEERRGEERRGEERREKRRGEERRGEEEVGEDGKRRERGWITLRRAMVRCAPCLLWTRGLLFEAFDFPQWFHVVLLLVAVASTFPDLKLLLTCRRGVA